MIVIKTFAVILVVAILSGTAISDQCGAKCDKSFAEKSAKGLALSEPCNRGCRLFSIHDATRNVVRSDPFSIFDLKRIGWPSTGKDETLQKCNKDCSDAYSGKDNKEDFVNACTEGCRNQQVSHETKSVFDDGMNDGFSVSFGNPGLFDFNTNIFDDIDRMMARSRSNFPSLLSLTRGNSDKAVERKTDVEAGQEGRSPFHSMFDSVHQNVRNLMQNVLSNFNHHVAVEQNSPMNENKSVEEGTGGKASEDDASHLNKEPETRSGGKLVVVQDGPGYHQEKTYNFGPNADVGKIFKEKMNDMMDHHNPLENFLKNDDVEIIDPFKSVSQKEEDKEENIKKNPQHDQAFDIQVFGPFVSHGINLDNSEESGENTIIPGFSFDDWGIGPKLPESGLKSRPLPVFHEVGDNNLGQLHIVVGDRNYEDVCAQDSRQMKWSDWVSCLHTRLGLPRWLMAATVCLGIIFTLWICLVIPSNAPKQRVKKSKKSVGTKELEANSLDNPHLAVIAVHKSYPLDLPPSYDDVTKTKVNLEPVDEKPTTVNLELDEKEAGALPEKTPNESQA